jgi:hypothetical protein
MLPLRHVSPFWLTKYLPLPLQEKIVNALSLKTSSSELQGYRLMWDLRPFMEDDVMHLAWKMCPWNFGILRFSESRWGGTSSKLYPCKESCIRLSNCALGGTRSVPQLLRWMPAQPVHVLPEAWFRQDVSYVLEDRRWIATSFVCSW